jgi:hypothetical protein
MDAALRRRELVSMEIADRSFEPRRVALRSGARRSIVKASARRWPGRAERKTESS